MSDPPDPRWTRLARWAVAMLLLGLCVAFVPGLAAGTDFLNAMWQPINAPPLPPGSGTYLVKTYGTPPNEVAVITGVIPMTFPPTSLAELVRTDTAWAIAAATLAAALALFVWWRRAAIGFGRAAGVASCAAASAAVCVLVLSRPDREYVSPGWTWITVPLGGALMAAAFLVAPAPRVRDE